MQRAELAWCQQVVTATGQHRPAGAQIGAEGAHQGGLPDPGLAGDERERTRSGRHPCRGAAQRFDLGAAFHQTRHVVHGGTITRRSDISDIPRAAAPRVGAAARLQGEHRSAR